MLGYTTIGVTDLARAETFYDALFAEMGGKQLMGQDRIKFYGNGTGGMVAICVPYNKEPQACGNGVMLAFPAKTSEEVDALHAKALELGATCDGEPGQRLPIFYGAYVRDLDGNKLCFYQMKMG